MTIMVVGGRGYLLGEDIIASAGNYNNNYTHNTQQAEYSRYLTHMNNIENYNIILYDFRSSGGSAGPSRAAMSSPVPPLQRRGTG